MAITFIKDKEPIFETENYDVVLVGVSTHNRLMGNFQCKMGVKYPIVEEVNNNTPYADLKKLGKRVTIDDIGKPIISLMYICTYPSIKSEFIDYYALEKCLKTANAEFKGKKVMTTILGSSRFDGRGDRNKCIEILEKSTSNLDLYVYDYEQISLRDELKEITKYINDLKKEHQNDKAKLKELSQLRRDMAKERYVPIEKCDGDTKKMKKEILNL